MSHLSDETPPTIEGALTRAQRGQSASKRQRSAPSRSFIRRHRGLVYSTLALVGGLLLIAIIVLIVLLLLLGNIGRVPLTIPEAGRPAQDDSVNILLLGADAGQERSPGTNSILEDAASDLTWPAGKYRSDATMLLHIDNDRKAAYVVSIPRDSYVDLYDDQGEKRQTSKVNAALSLYGPSGAVSTVEHLTDLRVDHLVLVDWDGFESITDALGGVRVTTQSDGTQILDGKQALAYVRERYSLPGGDFDRVKRQQNFLRSIMTGVIDRGTLTNPLKLRRTLSAITSNVAVEQGWSSGSIQSLAFSLRNLRPADVTFMTIPTRGTASDPVAGSIVVVNTQRSKKLWKAMQNDDVASFVDRYPDDVLGPATSVK